MQKILITFLEIGSWPSVKPNSSTRAFQASSGTKKYSNPKSSPSLIEPGVSEFSWKRGPLSMGPGWALTVKILQWSKPKYFFSRPNHPDSIKYLKNENIKLKHPWTTSISDIIIIITCVKQNSPYIVLDHGLLKCFFNKFFQNLRLHIFWLIFGSSHFIVFLRLLKKRKIKTVFPPF